MKTVCASEMAAILKIIENSFAQNAPELSLWGSSQLKNYFKILIYIKIPSISGDITKNVNS